MASLSSWHDAHARTTADFARRLEAGQRAVIPCHSLFEAYSVVTRLPLPFRISPRAASDALTESWRGEADVVGLGSEDVWRLLADWKSRDVGGGLAYDALIARLAYEAGAVELLTLNSRHFLRVAPVGLVISTPHLRDE